MFTRFVQNGDRVQTFCIY